MNWLLRTVGVLFLIEALFFIVGTKGRRKMLFLLVPYFAFPFGTFLLVENVDMHNYELSSAMLDSNSSFYPGFKKDFCNSLGKQECSDDEIKSAPLYLEALKSRNNGWWRLLCFAILGFLIPTVALHLLPKYFTPSRDNDT